MNTSKKISRISAAEVADKGFELFSMALLMLVTAYAITNYKFFPELAYFGLHYGTQYVWIMPAGMIFLLGVRYPQYPIFFLQVVPAVLLYIKFFENYAAEPWFIKKVFIFSTLSFFLDWFLRMSKPTAGEMKKKVRRFLGTCSPIFAAIVVAILPLRPDEGGLPSFSEIGWAVSNGEYLGLLKSYLNLPTLWQVIFYSVNYGISTMFTIEMLRYHLPKVWERDHADKSHLAARIYSLNFELMKFIVPTISMMLFW